jgi:hypothetical protein
LTAIPAEKVTEPALLTGFSGESLRKPLSESLAASGLAGFAGMARLLMILINENAHVFDRFLLKGVHSWIIGFIA